MIMQTPSAPQNRQPIKVDGFFLLFVVPSQSYLSGSQSSSGKFHNADQQTNHPHSPRQPRLAKKEGDFFGCLHMGKIKLDCSQCKVGGNREQQKMSKNPMPCGTTRPVLPPKKNNRYDGDQHHAGKTTNEQIHHIFFHGQVFMHVFDPFHQGEVIFYTSLSIPPLPFSKYSNTHHNHLRAESSCVIRQ